MRAGTYGDDALSGTGSTGTDDGFDVDVLRAFREDRVVKEEDFLPSDEGYDSDFAVDHELYEDLLSRDLETPAAFQAASDAGGS